MITNVNKLIINNALFVLGTIIAFITTVVLIVKQQPVETVAFGLIIFGFFLYKSIYYFKLIKKADYVEVQVQCLGNQSSTIGHSLTNSVIFDFAIIDDKYKNLVEDDIIRLQMAVSPKITKKGKEHYPYQKGKRYSIMFKKKEPMYFDNRNYINSVPLIYYIKGNNADENEEAS